MEKLLASSIALLRARDELSIFKRIGDEVLLNYARFDIQALLKITLSLVYVTQASGLVFFLMILIGEVFH